ncbi:DMT family transporter [Candidatus Saccharibacteria bacterium]|nr:DMT family transporter [Candidatus Saccharibacteria bacterium]
MSWQLLTLISVLSLSISVILQRTLIHRDKTDPFAYAVVFQGIVGILLMIVALSLGFKLPGIGAVILPAIISVIFYGVGHIVYAKTLQKVEASAFSVLFATQAVWIMALGIVLLGESLTALQVVGTILIFGGVGLLVKNLSSVFKDKGVFLGLLTGLMFGIAITAWSYVGRHTDTLSWAAISFIGTSLVAFLVRPKSLQKMKPLLQPKVLVTLLFLAVFYGIGSLAMLFAYKEGSFTIISPLRQTSIIVTVLLALAFLPQERNRIGRKILAALICAVGVVLIVI